MVTQYIGFWETRDLITKDKLNAGLWQVGLEADRPNTALEGVSYFATDTRYVYRYTTSTWVAIGRWFPGDGTTGLVASGGTRSTTVFRSSGVWTRPDADLVFSIEVYCVGGGGNGGAVGTDTSGLGHHWSGGGGGSGGLSIQTFSKDEVGASQVITVGARGTNASEMGGDSSFGTLITAGGGHEGAAAQAGNPPTPGAGGLGGTGTTMTGNTGSLGRFFLPSIGGIPVDDLYLAGRGGQGSASNPTPPLVRDGEDGIVAVSIVHPFGISFV